MGAKLHYVDTARTIGLALAKFALRFRCAYASSTMLGEGGPSLWHGRRNGLRLVLLGRYPNDFCPAGQLLAHERPIVAGVAEGEDAAIGSDEPVAAPVGGGSNAHYGPVEVDVPRGAIKARVAEGEDAAIGSDEPVAAPVGGGSNADYGPVEVDVPRGAIKARVAEGEDAAIGSDEPVAAPVGGG